LPDFDENSAAAVYIRLQGENETKMEESLETMLAWLHETGADLDKVWAVNQSDELEKMRIFRHSAPESINDMLDNYRSEERSIYKVSTDIQLSKVSPEEVFKIYKDELANFNLTGVSFGHLLLGHLHINIIPQNIEEHKKAEEFIENLTKIIAKKGGTICQEHGIGKLRKKQIQKDIYKNWLSNMESIKSVLDPKRIMGVDNILLSEGE
jgi:D-lactate dehydrogenase (cytochrome)